MFALSAGASSLVGCAQSVGEACQLNADCESGLVCCKDSVSISEHGSCQTDAVCSSARRPDAGIAIDGGTPPEDAGMSVEDAGAVAEDAGVVAEDAGAAADARVTDVDAGAADAGAADVDAGAADVDAGALAEDAGTDAG